MPIQPVGAGDVEGEVVLDAKYADGLSDLDGFSHAYLIYVFHKAGAPKLRVTPYLDKLPRGVFATRSPLRPNPIGLSIVEIGGISGNRMRIRGVDILDGTPLLDIKPYLPQFDHRENASTGWMRAARETIENIRSDKRFT